MNSCSRLLRAAARSSLLQPVRTWRLYPNPGTLRLRLLRAVTEPILARPALPNRTEETLYRHELVRARRQDNPGRDFLVAQARAELVDKLEAGGLVIFLESLYHRRYDEYRVENELMRKGFRVYYGNAVIVRAAAQGSRWAPVLERLSADGPNTAYALCAPNESTPGAAKAALRLLKGCTFWVPLGGALEGRLLTAAQLTAFADAPDLDAGRAQLVGAVQAGPARSLALLQAPQRRLLAQLTERQAQLAGAGDPA